MSKEDEALRQLIVELRLLEGSARVVQSRLSVVEATLSEIARANSTLEGLKGKLKGAEVLIPAGAGSFIRGEIIDPEKIVMGTGAGVCVERSIDSSIEELKNRSNDFERVMDSLQQQLSQTLSKIEEDRSKISALMRERDKGRQKSPNA